MATTHTPLRVFRGPERLRHEATHLSLATTRFEHPLQTIWCTALEAVFGVQGTPGFGLSFRFRLQSPHQYRPRFRLGLACLEVGLWMLCFMLQSRVACFRTQIDAVWLLLTLLFTTRYRVATLAGPQLDFRQTDQCV